MAKIAINGFGRIGRLFFRQAFNRPDLEIVAINDLGDPENMAYLLKHDSVYRDFGHPVQYQDNALMVGDKKVILLQERDPAKLPWRDMQIDIVVESTGVFDAFEKAAIHIKAAGAKRVVISAPAKDNEGVEGGKTALVGSNTEEIKTCTITSNGSCTTNATAPVVAIMDESIGIKKAMLTTVHGYTATQSIVDSPSGKKDMRRGRAGAQNIVPSSTGAATTVTKVFKNLEGKFDGLAMRVPVIAGSLVDLTFLAKRKTSVEEVNQAFKQAANSPNWKNILMVTEEPLVSSDIIGQPYGAIIDLRSTMVVDGDLVKVLSWYDNEWGYAATLVQHVLEAVA